MTYLLPQIDHTLVVLLYPPHKLVMYLGQVIFLLATKQAIKCRDPANYLLRRPKPMLSTALVDANDAIL